jgi:hypothetical protein
MLLYRSAQGIVLCVFRRSQKRCDANIKLVLLDAGWLLLVLFSKFRKQRQATSYYRMDGRPSLQVTDSHDVRLHPGLFSPAARIEFDSIRSAFATNRPFFGFLSYRCASS